MEGGHGRWQEAIVGREEADVGDASVVMVVSMGSMWGTLHLGSPVLETGLHGKAERPAPFFFFYIFISIRQMYKGCSLTYVCAYYVH
jgi:hypothetical protein